MDSNCIADYSECRMHELHLVTFIFRRPMKIVTWMILMKTHFKLPNTIGNMFDGIYYVIWNVHCCILYLTIVRAVVDIHWNWCSKSTNILKLQFKLNGILYHFGGWFKKQHNSRWSVWKHRSWRSSLTESNLKIDFALNFRPLYLTGRFEIYLICNRSTFRNISSTLRRILIAWINKLLLNWLIFRSDRIAPNSSVTLFRSSNGLSASPTFSSIWSIVNAVNAINSSCTLNFSRKIRTFNRDIKRSVRNSWHPLIALSK